MKVVIALGGNAILKKGEKPIIKNQLKNTEQALTQLYSLISKNKVVITHGNGPQVGNLLLQDEKTPLDVLDAETEGQMGYLIQQKLKNLFIKNNSKRSVTTILTQVLVDKNDKAFRNPAKFIGPYYKSKISKFKVREDSGKGYRRVVPSPLPIEIVESKIIKKLLSSNAVVIAAGGGGIPVIKKNKQLQGIEAVIDKDLASSCLATSIKAETLIMITDVDKVYLNYKKKLQKPIKKIKLKEIKEIYMKNQFPPGSMGPKILAAINFLSRGGKQVIITNIKNIKNSLLEKGGTIITK